MGGTGHVEKTIPSNHEQGLIGCQEYDHQTFSSSTTAFLRTAAACVWEASGWRIKEVGWVLGIGPMSIVIVQIPSVKLRYYDSPHIGLHRVTELL